MKQKLLALLLIALLMPLCTWASLNVDDTFTDNGIMYKVISTSPQKVQVGIGTTSATAIDVSTTGKLQIPSSVKGTDGNYYSVTTIGKGAFHYCISLTKITIPTSITSIGDGAFYGCNGLSDIHSLIENPFAINKNVFQTNSSSFTTATLHVPFGTKEKYASTDGWKEFKNIVEMEPTGETLKVWQDPETKVNYEYMSGESEASVKAGQKGLVAGSPEATGDINILSSFFVDEKEYMSPLVKVALI